MLRTERLVAFTIAGIVLFAAVGFRLDDTGPLLVLIDTYIIVGSLVAAVDRQRRRTTFAIGALLWVGAVALTTAAISTLGHTAYAASLASGLLVGTLVFAAWVGVAFLIVRALEAWSQRHHQRPDDAYLSPAPLAREF